jgi:hypothetical protein
MSGWSELDSTLQMFDRLRDIIPISIALEATPKRISEVVEESWHTGMSVWSELDSALLMFDCLRDIVQASIAFETSVE